MSRLYFPELDLSKETIDTQMEKVMEEFDELIYEVRTPERDHHRIYSEAMDLVQSTLGLLRILRRVACDDGDTQAHYSKLASRPRKIIGNIMVDEVDHDKAEVVRLREELSRERQKVNALSAVMESIVSQNDDQLR